jgi:hypothetical protein
MGCVLKVAQPVTAIIANSQIARMEVGLDVTIKSGLRPFNACYPGMGML